MAVEIAAVGRPRKLPWKLPWTSADFRGDCRVAIGNRRGWPWKLPRQFARTLPWQLLRNAVGCHGWYDGVCHGQNRGTCRGHNRGTYRGSAMRCGTCRGNPWIRTVARGNTHGQVDGSFVVIAADLRQKVK